MLNGRCLLYVNSIELAMKIIIKSLLTHSLILFKKNLCYLEIMLSFSAVFTARARKRLVLGMPITGVVSPD